MNSYISMVLTSRTLSFPKKRRFGVCSFNANEEERGGSRRRVGVWPWAAGGPGTMRSVTVDVSQWRGAHSLWTRSVNLILEHSGSSGGSPGALYLNNILLNIIYLYHILSRPNLCGTGKGTLAGRDCCPGSEAPHPIRHTRQLPGAYFRESKPKFLSPSQPWLR